MRGKEKERKVGRLRAWEKIKKKKREREGERKGG